MKIETLLLTILGSCLSFGCQPLITDSGFDLWCGDSLCKWKTETGSIRQVPTWHEKDYGVELVDRPTVISQEVTPTAPNGCLKFSIIADVAAEAEVDLEFDFFSDDFIEHAQPIPGVHWQTQELLVKLPDTLYSGLTLKLDKKGTGRAVFAELSADFTEDCHGDPILLQNFEVGARCGEAAQCNSTSCTAASPANPTELTCSNPPP
jgi:hypothetical protein